MKSLVHVRMSSNKLTLTLTPLLGIKDIKLKPLMPSVGIKGFRQPAFDGRLAGGCSLVLALVGSYTELA